LPVPNWRLGSFVRAVHTSTGGEQKMEDRNEYWKVNQLLDRLEPMLHIYIYNACINLLRHEGSTARLDGDTKALSLGGQRDRSMTLARQDSYSTRHNYTGGGPNVRIFVWHPLGQPNMRWSNSDACKW
jgi:hypothetical protein